MARGWESKGVEEQLEARAANSESSPAPSSASQEQQRALANLRLQREHILNQRTSNPHRRAALEAALQQIEDEMAALGEEPPPFS